MSLFAKSVFFRVHENAQKCTHTFFTFFIPKPRKDLLTREGGSQKPRKKKVPFFHFFHFLQKVRFFVIFDHTMGLRHFPSLFWPFFVFLSNFRDWKSGTLELSQKWNVVFFLSKFLPRWAAGSKKTLTKKGVVFFRIWVFKNVAEIFSAVFHTKSGHELPPFFPPSRPRKTGFLPENRQNCAKSVFWAILGWLPR